MAKFPGGDPTSPFGLPAGSGEPGPLGSPGVPGGLPFGEASRPRATTLLEAAANFSAHIPIDETVLNGYVRDQSRILRTDRDGGGRDRGTLESFKLMTLLRLVENVQSIEAGNFFDAAAGTVPEPDMTGSGTLEQKLKVGANREWVRYLASTQGMGLHRSNVLMLGLTTFYTSYGPELNRNGSMDKMLFPPDRSQTRGAFQDTVLAGRPSASAVEITNAFRSKGEGDVSQTLLDRRVTAFLSLASIELQALAIEDLRQMGKLGGQYASQAQELLATYKDALFASANTPRDMLREAAAFLRGANARTSDRDNNTKRVLSALARRIQGVVDHIETLGPDFRQIYDAFGYEYPPALSPRVVLEVEPPAGEAALEPGQQEGGPGDELSEDDVAVAGAARSVSQEAVRRALYTQFDAIVLAKEHGKVDHGKFRERMRRAAEAIVEGTPGADVEMVWARLNDLGEIWDEFGGELFVSKQGSLGNAPPYFFVVFGEEGSRFVVAETPVPDNATYVISERHVPGTVFEVLLLKRTEAREVGAVQVIHSAKHPHGPGHTQKIRDHITRLSATEGI